LYIAETRLVERGSKVTTESAAWTPLDGSSESHRDVWIYRQSEAIQVDSAYIIDPTARC